MLLWNVPCPVVTRAHGHVYVMHRRLSSMPTHSPQEPPGYAKAESYLARPHRLEGLFFLSSNAPMLHEDVYIFLS